MSDLFKNHIPLMRPWIDDEEINGVIGVLKSGWIVQGERVSEFEKVMAEYIGAKEAVATNACTSSLHLSMAINGITAGDLVVCPSFTCMASANAILHCGAFPKFCDIDPLTYNLSPRSVEESIDEGVKAILVVHQKGLPANLAEIYKIANKHNIKVIEDAACSLGATTGGSRLGSFGPPTCFSFHPRKVITAAEGGMILTDDLEFAGLARQMRSTGASSSDLMRHKAKGSLVPKYETVGYNYRMTDIHAAIGLAQFKKLPKILLERAKQSAYYNNGFSDVEEIAVPHVPTGSTHAWSSYLIKIVDKKISRNDLLHYMSENGVSCRIGIQPLHLEPFFKNDFGHLHLPETIEAADRALFLPIFPGLTEEEQHRVVILIKEFIRKG